MRPKKKTQSEPGEPRPFVADNEAAKRHWPAALALFVLTLAAFSNSFQAGFAWDNQYLILQDPRIRAATSENIALIFQHSYWWPTGEAGLYRPLTTLSYLFNYGVLGQREAPAGYHWTNFALHYINVLLAYAVALRLIRRFWPSVFISAIWGVHPALTESVTNIVGRSDLLAGMATLSGFLLYLKSVEATGGRRIGWLAGLVAVTALGVYSKESAVVIVGVIVLYELAWWDQRKAGKSLLYGCAATLPPITIMLWHRSSVLAGAAAEFPFTDNPIAMSSFWVGRLTAIKVVARYLWLTVWPARLSVDYSYSEIPLATGSHQDWFAWTIVAAAVILVVALYRRNRTAFFFACFAAVTFLPTANLLFPIGSIMADRFLYLPSLGLLACLTLAICGLGERLRYPSLAPVLLCLVASGFALRTWVRNLDWKDDFTLASAGIRASPRSYKVHKVLASRLYASDPSHSNLERVTNEAEKTLAILDSLPDALNEPDAYRWSGGFYLSKGDLLRKRGQDGSQAYERARQVLVRCIAIDKAHSNSAAIASSEPEAYRLLSAVYLRLGDTGKAKEAAALARSLNPTAPEGYRQAAEALLAAGDVEEAAIMLMSGVLITSNEGVRQDLLSLYQSGLDTKGCAIARGPNGPVMNPGCAIVQRHVCAAAVNAIKVARERGRQDLALAQKQNFVQDFGCPSGPLEQALRQ